MYSPKIIHNFFQGWMRVWIELGIKERETFESAILQYLSAETMNGKNCCFIKVF